MHVQVIYCKMSTHRLDMRRWAVVKAKHAEPEWCEDRVSEMTVLEWKNVSGYCIYVFLHIPPWIAVRFGFHLPKGV